MRAKAPNIGDSPETYHKIDQDNAILANNQSIQLVSTPFEFLTPIIAPDDWQSASTYKTGDFVKNADNYYVCWVGGTTAETAITSTHSAPIEDGSVKWYYVCKASLANGVDIPTITVSARLSSHTKYYEANNALYTDNFTFTGGVPTVVGVGLRFPSVNVSPSNGNAVGHFSSLNPTVHFYSDAQSLTLQGRSVMYDSGEGTLCVDDVPVMLGMLRPTTTINPCGIVVDWGDAPRKTRKYSFTLKGSKTFYGVYTNPTDRVWAVEKTHRVVWCGDSLIAGANSFPLYPSSDIATIAGLKLGTYDSWNVGSGGTGFISDSNGTRTNHIGRLGDFTEPNPDTLIIAGMHNDSGYTDEDQRSAFDTFLRAFRSAVPHCRIIIFGTCYGSTQDPSPFENSENIMAEVISAIDDFNTVWLPVATSPSPWVFGVGNDQDQRGNGNVDFFQSNDSTHPNQNGIWYRAQNYINGILSVS